LHGPCSGGGNVANQDRLLVKNLLHCYISFIYLKNVITAFQNINLRCVNKNVWMKDPFPLEDSVTKMTFNLTLVGKMKVTN
jgi:hypothetical protein